MKKTLILASMILLGFTSAQAQLGGLLNKAAQKAGSKAANAAASAIKNRLGLDSSIPAEKVATDEPAATEAEATPTIADLMSQMPALPTAAQLADFRRATVNEQSLRILASPVTSFNTQVYMLAAQATAIAYANLDSAAVASMAMRYAGLTEAEVKAMENMSEEEQETYLASIYQSGRADQVRMQAVQNTAKYAEQTAGLVEQYSAIDDKVEAVYAEALKKMKPIYSQYAARLASTEGKEHDQLEAEYYAKVIDMQRSAVETAMQIRRSEQLPIAESIEQINAGIRTQDPGAIVPNYLQLVAVAYFGEAAKLMETPDSFNQD